MCVSQIRSSRSNMPSVLYVFVYWDCILTALHINAVPLEKYSNEVSFFMKIFIIYRLCFHTNNNILFIKQQKCS